MNNEKLKKDIEEVTNIKVNHIYVDQKDSEEIITVDCEGNVRFKLLFEIGWFKDTLVDIFERYNLMDKTTHNEEVKTLIGNKY